MLISNCKFGKKLLNDDLFLKTILLFYNGLFRNFDRIDELYHPKQSFD